MMIMAIQKWRWMHQFTRDYIQEYLISVVVVIWWYAKWGGGLGWASCRGGELRILDSPKKHGWRRSSSCAECPCLLACFPIRLPCHLLKCSNAHSQTPYPPLPPPQIFAKWNLFLQVGGKIFLFAVICVQAFSSKVINSSPLIFSCVIWIAPPRIGGIMWYFPLMPQLLNKNTHKFPMPAPFQFVWSFSWIVYDEWQKHRSLASTGNHLKTPGGLSREHDLDCKREMRPQ